jgi:signal transduction histidine kinase
MPERFAQSLSVRLLVIFLLLGGLFVFGTFKAIQIVYNSDDIRGLVSGHLSLHVSYVRDDIGSPPRIERAIAITQRVPVDIRMLGPGLDWASDPNFPRLSELEFAPSPTFSDDPNSWVDELQGVEFADWKHHRLLKIGQGDYDIVVSTPRIADMPGGIDLTHMIVGMGLMFLLLAYAAVSWLFRPISMIREGSAHIGRGNFDFRIENIRRDELGGLANDINHLAADVERMLDAKRALLLGISHELRTPLSRMRLTLEFLEDEKNRESLKEEILEMEKIVAALLEAERLNARHASLARTNVLVRDLIQELLSDFFGRELDRIQVSQSDDELRANIDEGRITLLLKNLLSNALRYSKSSDGPVELAVTTDQSELVLTVRDHGPGLPEDDADHIGEPFYRGDRSRARESGGTGLGLYLATLVARAHGGSLRLLDNSPSGACFEVRIPLT